MDLDSIPNGAVVVALQGDADTERPLRWAAHEAALTARPLVTLHVEPSESAARRSWTSPARDAAELCRDAFPGMDVRAASLVGSARDHLVAASERAHLLVLGSRGRGIFRSMLLGSTSAAVTNRCACPVVVVRPASDQPAGAPVVVGADGTRDSLPVIEFAFRYASLHDRPLQVVHCYWDAGVVTPQGLLPPPSDVAELRAVLSQSVSGMGEKFPDVEVSTRLSMGLVDECLTRDSEAHHLLVVGRHPVNVVLRMLTGSMATAVLASATTAVAVVPETTDPVRHHPPRAAS